MAKKIGCKCNFKNNLQKSKSINRLLEKHGNNLPPDVILDATSHKNLDKWETICDCNNRNKVISGARYHQTDWYLWTIKNLATNKKYRKKGLGGNIISRIMVKAEKDKIPVIVADVDRSNVESQHIFEKIGFKRVNKFCWKKGEEPANILHYVNYPPIGNKCI